MRWSEQHFRLMGEDPPVDLLRFDLAIVPEERFWQRVHPEDVNQLREEFEVFKLQVGEREDGICLTVTVPSTRASG